MAAMTIFVVEDDEYYRELIAHAVSMDPDYRVGKYGTAASFLNDLHKAPDVVTLDYRLPDMEGGELLRKIRDFNPDIEVIIISEQEKIEVAVDLLAEGAYDYIVKSKNIRDRLLNSLRHIQSARHLKRRVEHLQKEVETKYDFQRTIIGSSQPIRDVFHLISKAVRSTITVTITGETGTGKELAARAIHYNSARKDESFVAVNVAAIPSELIESELFGHEKGAFTGASFQRTGRFEEAHLGTLFLDEVGEMEPAMQVKLLRVLQEKEINRVGSNKPVKVDCRIIVATHRDLLREVKEGRFREDLYFRLYGLTIEMPPLRERGEDIILLARHFVNDFCSLNQMEVPSISREARQKLLQYNYPGNVRELKSVVELATVMSDGETIQAGDIQFRRNEELYDPPLTGMTMKEHTQRIIRLYLDKHDNNIKEAARELDISYSTIYRMLKEEDPS